MASESILNPYYQLKFVSHDFWELYGDPRVSKYFLFSSGPWITLTAIGIYLSFVKIIGPQMMRDRKPLELRRLMVLYNIAMVLLSFYIFAKGCSLLNFGLDTWGCRLVRGQPVYDNFSHQFLDLAWLFFFSKLIEFADTVFFVLRKKSSQITSLHVIHHSVVPISVWMGFKFAPDGNNAFFPLLNSGIHTLMYSYYGLTAAGNALGIQEHLARVKKYLTAAQICQFLLAIVHGFSSFFSEDCANAPKASYIINLLNASMFLVLFCSFYRRAYTKPHKQS